MLPKIEVKAREDVVMHFDGKLLSSIEPCTALFGYTYWSCLIPPFKPDNVLILGAGKGTVRDLLIRVFQHDLIIEQVDSDPIVLQSGIVHTKDAREFLEESKDTWDYIVVDLSDEHGIIPMVFSNEFVELVKKHCSRMVGLNCFDTDRDRARIWSEQFSVESMNVIQNNLIFKLRLPYLVHTMQETYDFALKEGLEKLQVI